MYQENMFDIDLPLVTQTLNIILVSDPISDQAIPLLSVLLD